MQNPIRSRASLWIVGVYAAFSLAWIWFSDRWLLRIIQDPVWLTQVQIYKGWAWVTFSSVLLYVLLRIETARRDRAERALQERERQLCTLIGNLPGMVYRCHNDRNWTMEYISDGVLGLSGYPAADFREQRRWFKDVIHPDDRERVWRAVQAALQTRQRYALTYRVVSASGEEKWAWEQGCGVYDAEGRATMLEGFVTDITEERRGQEAVRTAHERLKLLSQRLIEVQEAERRHLARELHDEIGQALTATKINLQALQRFPDPASLSQRLEQAVSLMDRLIDEVRNLSLNLRPQMLDDLGLVACLRWLLDQRVRDSGIEVEFIAGQFEERLDPTVETACFRVAQEALTNVIRHSRASRVRVELDREPDGLRLSVRDNGTGFFTGDRRLARSRSGLGLLGMEERAALLGGTLEVVSAPGHGTEVKAWFPLLNDEAAGKADDASLQPTRRISGSP